MFINFLFRDSRNQLMRNYLWKWQDMRKYIEELFVEIAKYMEKGLLKNTSPYV